VRLHANVQDHLHSYAQGLAPDAAKFQPIPHAGVATHESMQCAASAASLRGGPVHLHHAGQWAGGRHRQAACLPCLLQRDARLPACQHSAMLGWRRA
jgi:hypothetical protein